jgi:hypothetical protein
MIITSKQTATKRRLAVYAKADLFKRTTLTSTTSLYNKVSMVILHQNASPFLSSGASNRRRRSLNFRVILCSVGLCVVCVVILKIAQTVLSFEPNDGLHRSMMAAATIPANRSNVKEMLRSASWRNDYNVVHVIQTRFMQNQPELLALAQARLHLFQALTIPSMQHQTVQNFLWIIRTDPALDSKVKLELIGSLSGLSNAVLVASNANPEGFRQQSCIADISADSLLSGNLALVHSYHEAAARHTVLETRCDADDALSIDFVETIQSSANSQLHRAWMVWCVENHLEWQYDSPWTNTTTTGALLGLKAGKCITPGLTWGYSVDASRSDIPVSKHQQIQKIIPACGGKSRSTHDEPRSKCLIKIGGEMPLALRARTPTSAGMDHILITDHTESAFPMDQLQKSKWRHSQSTLWESLTILFGVDATHLWRVRAHIHEHFEAIVRDALVGQCTHGHSCKEGSREILKGLLDRGNRNK